jgi:uncharacterized RmlC-like cupin family protein
MTEATTWRTDGVTVVRAAALHMARQGRPEPDGRPPSISPGPGGRETWIGTATLRPNAKTGAHHHGRHEVAVVPHQELNLDAREPLDFVVVRRDREGIVVDLDVVPVEQPETVYG